MGTNAKNRKASRLPPPLPMLSLRLAIIDPGDLVLWRHPLDTSKYFLQECVHLMRSVLRNLIRARYAGKAFILITASLLVLPLIFSNYAGSEEGAWWPVYKNYFNMVFRFAYWFVLGVLSSIGLGSGLHTFVLYLGPHIARVTQAAYECNTTDFPEPPYPDKIVCPSAADANYSAAAVYIFDIFQKVWVAAFLWALGTAVGELPPFLLAKRAAKQVDYVERAEEVLDTSASMIDRFKRNIKNAVQSYGFLTIFLSACVPNPLFDMASITCGNFGMPVWKFCLATALGKAGVKINVQILTVIVTFSKQHYENLLTWLQQTSLPLLGNQLSQILSEQLIRQKQLLHNSNASSQASSQMEQLLPAVEAEAKNPNFYIVNAVLFVVRNGFSIMVSLMVAYFAVSVVNAMAQDYYKRSQETIASKAFKLN